MSGLYAIVSRISGCRVYMISNLVSFIIFTQFGCPRLFYHLKLSKDLAQHLCYNHIRGVNADHPCNKTTVISVMKQNKKCKTT